MIMNQNKKEIVIEPVMLTDEWPRKQLCDICQERADKQVTIYGNPDGIPRVLRDCTHCIDTEDGWRLKMSDYNDIINGKKGI